FVFFFFQAEDGIRDRTVTGVQTCALPILFLLAAPYVLPWYFAWAIPMAAFTEDRALVTVLFAETVLVDVAYTYRLVAHADTLGQIGRASCRERGVICGVSVPV